MRLAPFITLEGPEGAGKSIQATLLGAFLEEQGWPVLLTREPGGTALGDEIRHILLHSGDLAILPETEVLLLAAGRAQHVREKIVPALASGTAVVCDRYVDSTYAYQGGGHGLPMADLRRIQEYATGGLEPDLRLLIDVPIDVGLARRHAEAGSVNRIDLAPGAFHQRVREAFLSLAAANAPGWSVIDGRGDVASVARKVHTEVQSRVLVNYPHVRNDALRNQKGR
jgi:dTMP kinase